MITFIEKKRPSFIYQIFSAFVAFTFCFSILTPPTPSYAQTLLNLPIPGTMIHMSEGFVPTLIKGMSFYPDNPLQFDFIVDSGDVDLNEEALKGESTKLIKYFLAALTVPVEEMWVNLSPYERDRIITEKFGQTEMGRDLLAQDYILKQLTSSLMYPEDAVGQKFWDRVYAKAQQKFNTTEIPVNTFNKIWIVPDRAYLYEGAEGVFIIDSHLKVMLEEDYVALSKNLGVKDRGFEQLEEQDVKDISGASSQAVREVLIPEIEKEVNEGKNFANLRQIYNSMILAVWYKQHLQKSLLGQVYVDKNKVKGVDVADKEIKQKIYGQYLEAFKKGVYDYIKEDYDSVSKTMIPRKYFAGGFAPDFDKAMLTFDDLSSEQIGKARAGVRRLFRLLTSAFSIGPKGNVEAARNLLRAAPTGILAQRVTTTRGAKTGEVHIDDAVLAGANGIIAGHSEPRGNFARETDAEINKQLKAAHDRNLKDIILCVGESDEEKQNGKSLDVVKKQVMLGLKGLTNAEVEKTIVAYEPRWAIKGSGYGQPATETDAASMAAFIRKIIGQSFSPEVAQKVRIIYGGSVDKNNAESYLTRDNIDGLLVGGKSTSVAEFRPILEIAEKVGPTDGRIPYIGANWKTYPIKDEPVDFIEFLGELDSSRVQSGIAPPMTHINNLALTVALTESERLTPDEKTTLQNTAETFPSDVVTRTAGLLTRYGLRGAYKQVDDIVRSQDLPIVKANRIRQLFAQLANKTQHTTVDDMHRWISRKVDEGAYQEILAPSEVKKYRKVIKDTADGMAKQIYEKVAKELGVILMVRVSEGFGRDRVMESLKANEVILPDELKDEADEVVEEINEGKHYYRSEKNDRTYLITSAIIDVIEGTNMFVTNSNGHTRETIQDYEAGSTSVIVIGDGVTDLGNAPDGYVGQFFTNLGEHAEEFKDQRILRTDRHGRLVEFSLRDPELYAQHPDAIVEYLKFLAKIRGQKLEEVEEEITLMQREREDDLIAEIRKLQQTIPGLRITGEDQKGITDGTVAHGLKAVMTPEVYEKATGRAYGIHKTQITVGGSAEGFMNLAIAGALKAKGAVGGLRVYSVEMNKNADGEKVHDKSERYNFHKTTTEGADIRECREQYGDADKILKGEKVFYEEDVKGGVSGAFSFISANGVFDREGVSFENGEATIDVLRIEAQDGEPAVAIVKNKMQEGTDVPTLQPLADAAMMTERYGGIDLNPVFLDMQIKMDEKGVPLPLEQQPIGSMHIEGFLPVIINVTPIQSLPFLLGENEQEKKQPELAAAG